MKFFSVIAAAFLLSSATLFAVPITTGHIPADSQIAVSIDFAKAKTLPTCSAAVDWLFANVKYLRNQSAILQRSFGLNIKDDISKLYVFSDGLTMQNSQLDISSATSLANATFNRANLTAKIKNAKGYQSTTVGNHTLMSGDFAPGYWLTFPDNDTAILSASNKAAAKALNVLLRKSPSISPTSPIAKEFAKNAPVSIVCIGKENTKNLSIISGGLIKADAKLIVLQITEKSPGTAKIGIAITLSDPATAAQVFATLNGLKLLLSFQQGSKLPSGVLESLLNTQMSLNNTQVSLTFSVKATDLAKLK